MLHPVELVHWLQMQLNRPSAHFAEARFWSLYQHEGRPLDGCPDALKAHARTELLVVITTYGRPDSFRKGLVLLRAALDAVSPVPSLRVLVLNDRSPADYGGARTEARALFGDDLTWLDARERLGKPGFWKAYQVAFLVARAVQPEYALFLQDDLEYTPALLRNAQAHWQATAHDARRRVLYLFSSTDDERYGRWTVFARRRVSPDVFKTQWFDLQAFLVDRAFFELLDYRMVPIHDNRWRRRPGISSGVGRQLTIRLRGRANVYQLRPALVLHGALHSEMNPTARARRPLDNRDEAARRDEDASR